MSAGSAEVFLPAPASDYDGWGLDPRPEVTCPDCDEVSPEFEELGALLTWIDKHLKTCSPAWTEGARTP